MHTSDLTCMCKKMHIKERNKKIQNKNLFMMQMLLAALHLQIKNICALTRQNTAPK